MKKVISLLLITAILASAASCGNNEKDDSGTAPNTENVGSANVIYEATLPELKETGNTVAEPNEKLPVITAENGNCFVTVDGFKSIEFALPKTVEDAFSKLGNADELKDLYLTKVPTFSISFPHELTDAVLANYQECEPSLSSINAESAYQDSTGTVKITYGKSMTGKSQYIYQQLTEDGTTLANVYFDGETRQILSITEYLYDYEKDLYKDGGRKFKVTRSTTYTNGIPGNIFLEAENTNYSKDGEHNFYEEHKASLSYEIKDNQVSAMNDGYFRTTFNVDQSDGYSYNYVSLTLHFDQNGKLEAVQDFIDHNDYFYLFEKNAWFTANGDRIE